MREAGRRQRAVHTVVNDAHPTAFSFATFGLEPPKLPQATRSRDEISSLGVYNQCALERRVLEVAEELRNLARENGGFKELKLHRGKCTPLAYRTPAAVLPFQPRKVVCA